MASEFAVSEVFSHKKPQSGSSSSSRGVPLLSSDLLRDHDDSYSEAQALLGDWLSSRLRLELEMEEEDDLMCSAESGGPAALACAQPSALNCENFNDFYSCLAEEEEHSTVNGVLQDLMEQEVLDSGMMEELALDVGQSRKKFRNPLITMEARHQQVQENKARRDAERQRQQREREAQRVAREEAKKNEREEETRRTREARRQEEMVQQEMTRLRRQMEERRGLEQLVRQRRCQLAVESDRRRLLRHCLNKWQLWCRTAREQRELLAQQQETRSKMAALISAASTGKLSATATPTSQPTMTSPEASNQPETTEKAEMKAAEEQKQCEEEEEKRRAAEKRKEERRLEREREEEKQTQLIRQQEFLKVACQHYHKTLLLQRGLAPWKRLIQLRQANTQLKDWRVIQEEQAERFHRERSLRRFMLALLDHVAQQRLVEWDRQALAQEHNNRFAAPPLLPYVRCMFGCNSLSKC
ncbi:hypothetical protein F2P81_019173 [Scophthalmus maximus]|uniref:Coiled-coil domain-containing protein KIAA1407-like n=1 Tax=Scophthalmus maximus TaxID=52904 RepID=A0A6A4RYY3_SCOMX|nr:hypothetical protein F2P81_019173 [Scophthalmus maximus]